MVDFDTFEQGFRVHEWSLDVMEGCDGEVDTKPGMTEAVT
jgi:hypothetical protein